MFHNSICVVFLFIFCRVSDVGRPVSRVFYLRTSKAVVLCVWRGGLECIGILLFYIQCCSSDTGSVLSYL